MCKKNKIIIFLSLMVLIMAHPLSAGVSNKVIIYTTSNDSAMKLVKSPVVGAEIVSNKKDDTGVFRLEFDNDVKTLADDAFAGQTQLLTIALPDTVLTTIGKAAFKGCTALHLVSGGKNVTTIGSEAYAGTCLSVLSFPQRVTQIPDKVCFNCAALKSVSLPDSLREIGARAFCGDTSLTAIIWPQKLGYVGDSCFYNCPNLHSIVSLAPTPPEGMNNLTTVGGRFYAILYYLAAYKQPYENNPNLKNYTTKRVALTNQHKLTYTLTPNADVKSFHVGNAFNAPVVAVVLDSSKQVGRSSKLFGSIYFAEPVTVIGMEAFKNSYQLQSIALPDQITAIEQGAFENCTSLDTITIGKGVRYVDKQAFAGCTALTQIVLPHATETIGDKAFKNCTNLKKIVLGFGMTDIGYNVFENCAAMDTIISYSYLPPRLASVSSFLWMKPQATLLVPEESKNDYENGIWGQYYEWKNIEPVVSFSFARQLAVKETVQLTPHIQAQDKPGSIVWTSSDPTIVSVDATGKVTALKNSNKDPITITATTTVDSINVTEQVQFVIVDKVNKEPDKYTINVANYEHGHVQLSCTQGVAGTSVFVTIKPDDGYGLQTLTVETNDKQPVPLYRSLSTEGKYQFVLPATNVVITPIFVAL